jgi:hypothetical protein
LRKPLRLIVDDTDDSRPNDISYVYSGYAPLSIRLVQCVTQKNAVQAAAAPNADAGDEAAPSRKAVPRAHPLSSWRGFEDVLGSIPGETVDTRQKAGQRLEGAFESRWEGAMIDIRYARHDDDGGVLPRRMYIYRDIRSAVDGKADKRETISHLHYRHRKWEHGKSAFFAPSLPLLTPV